MSAQALCVSYQVSAGWWRREALRAVDGVSLDLYSERRSRSSAPQGAARAPSAERSAS